jgi:hypothetical protein
MVFQKQKIEGKTIMEPDSKYYLHRVCENAFMAPADSIPTKAWDEALMVVELCAYQAEVLAKTIGVIEKENAVAYYEAVAAEEKKLTGMGVKDKILTTKLSYFKIGYILRDLEGRKPDKSAMSV